MSLQFRFGNRSESNLVGVHPRHIKVVRLALLITEIDFLVYEGVRTLQRQRELYAQGRSKAGNIVTWTMSSKHLKQPDGYGHAVDLLPINPATKKPDWDFSEGFSHVAASMLAAAEFLETPIRWGRDWNRNRIVGEKGETDSPHFELVEI